MTNLRVRHLIAIIAPILLLSLFAVFEGKNTYRKIKGLRAAQLAQQALDDYLESPDQYQNLKNLILNAQNAHMLSPTNYDTNRVLGTILTLVKPQDALIYWRNAIEVKDEISTGHALAYTQCLIVNGFLKEAQITLEEQTKKSPEDYRIHYNLSKIELLLGHTEKAYSLAQKLIRNPQAPLEFHLYFIRMGINSDFRPWIKRANSHTTLLIKNESLLSEGLIWQFLEIEGLDSEIEIKLSKMIQKFVYTFQQEVDHIEFKVKNNQLTAENGYKYLFQKLDVNNEGQRYMLASWSQNHELSQEIADLISNEMAVKRRPWYLLLLRHLSKIEDWDRIKFLLDHHAPPIDKFWMYIMKARVLDELGERAQAINAWYRAKLELPTDLNLLNTLFTVGYQLKLFDDTLTLINPIVTLSESPEAAFRLLGEKLLVSKNYSELYKLLQKFRTGYPFNEEIINEWAYYAFMLNIDTEQATIEIENLCQKYPNRLRYHMTWAAGQITHGKYRPVLGHLRHFDVDWDQLYPKWRFILAMALAGAGEKEQALYYLEGINLDHLIPHERTIYKKLIQIE